MIVFNKKDTAFDVVIKLMDCFSILHYLLEISMDEMESYRLHEVCDKKRDPLYLVSYSFKNSYLEN